MRRVFAASTEKIRRFTYAGVVSEVLEVGPCFHGTKADLREGDLLTAGFRSNYRPEVVMNHIYFTALVDAEVSDWPRLTPEALQAWRDRLAALLGDERAEIIN